MTDEINLDKFVIFSTPIDKSIYYELFINNSHSFDKEADYIRGVKIIPKDYQRIFF